VTALLTSDIWRTEMISFISSDGADCGVHLTNISELSSVFATRRIGVVHVVVERSDLSSRDPSLWFRDTAALLKRFVMTLETIIKHDATTRVIVHVDVVATLGYRDIKSLCRDPFTEGSRDFYDVILSTIYSFTDVYRNLYKMRHVYNILYARPNS